MVESRSESSAQAVEVVDAVDAFDAKATAATVCRRCVAAEGVCFFLSFCFPPDVKPFFVPLIRLVSPHVDDVPTTALTLPYCYCHCRTRIPAVRCVVLVRT